MTYVVVGILFAIAVAGIFFSEDKRSRKGKP